MPVIIAIALLSFYLTPWASQKIEEYRVQLKSRDEVAAISPGVFKESNGKL
jgi:lipopolysaccharide export system permease protein